MTQSIQQKRAKFALEQIEGLQQAPFAKECRAYLSNMPSMIRMNGLGQALAFCLMKSKENNNLGKAYTEIYRILQTWLLANSSLKATRQTALMNAITSANMQQYREAEVEILQILDWLKKFARAMLKGE